MSWDPEDLALRQAAATALTNAVRAIAALNSQQQQQQQEEGSHQQQQPNAYHLLHSRLW